MIYRLCLYGDTDKFIFHISEIDCMIKELKRMRKQLILKIGEKYYISEVGGFFKFKIYDISKADSPSERFPDDVDFEIIKNKTYSLRDHIIFYYYLLKDKIKKLLISKEAKK